MHDVTIPTAQPGLWDNAVFDPDRVLLPDDVAAKEIEELIGRQA